MVAVWPHFLTNGWSASYTFCLLCNLDLQTLNNMKKSKSNWFISGPPCLTYPPSSWKLVYNSFGNLINTLTKQINQPTDLTKNFTLCYWCSNNGSISKLQHDATVVTAWTAITAAEHEVRQQVSLFTFHRKPGMHHRCSDNGLMHVLLQFFTIFINLNWYV